MPAQKSMLVGQKEMMRTRLPNDLGLLLGEFWFHCLYAVCCVVGFAKRGRCKRWKRTWCVDDGVKTMSFAIGNEEAAMERGSDALMLDLLKVQKPFPQTL